GNEHDDLVALPHLDGVRTLRQPRIVAGSNLDHRAIDRRSSNRWIDSLYDEMRLSLHMNGSCANPFAQPGQLHAACAEGGIATREPIVTGERAVRDYRLQLRSHGAPRDLPGERIDHRDAAGAGKRAAMQFSVHDGVRRGNVRKRYIGCERAEQLELNAAFGFRGEEPADTQPGILRQPEHPRALESQRVALRLLRRHRPRTLLPPVDSGLRHSRRAMRQEWVLLARS